MKFKKKGTIHNKKKLFNYRKTPSKRIIETPNTPLRNTPKIEKIKAKEHTGAIQRAKQIVIDLFLWIRNDRG